MGPSGGMCSGNAYEWIRALITATNGARRDPQVNDVRDGSD